MSRYAHLSDDALIAAASVARDKAHNAPKALSGPDDRPAYNPMSDAYARFARAWADMREEMQRRGLPW